MTLTKRYVTTVEAIFYTAPQVGGHLVKRRKANYDKSSKAKSFRGTINSIISICGSALTFLEETSETVNY